MLPAHSDAFIRAERDYRLERSRARFVEVTNRRLARQRRKEAAERAGGAVPAAGGATALSLRSA
jgi:hypothetical protein